MGLLGVHNDLVVEEKQLVVVEEEVGKQAEERDMTAVLAAFPEYKSILLETQVVVSSRHLYIKKISIESLCLQGCLDDWPRSSASDPPALHRPPRLLRPQVPNHSEDSGGNMASLGPLVFMECTCSFNIKFNKKPLGGGVYWSRGRPHVATRRGSNTSEKARLRQQVSKSIQQKNKVLLFNMLIIYVQ